MDGNHDGGDTPDGAADDGEEEDDDDDLDDPALRRRSFRDRLEDDKAGGRDVGGGDDDGDDDGDASISCCARPRHLRAFEDIDDDIDGRVSRGTLFSVSLPLPWDELDGLTAPEVPSGVVGGDDVDDADESSVSVRPVNGLARSSANEQCVRGCGKSSVPWLPLLILTVSASVSPSPLGERSLRRLCTIAADE